MKITRREFMASLALLAVLATVVALILVRKPVSVTFDAPASENVPAKSSTAVQAPDSAKVKSASDKSRKGSKGKSQKSQKKAVEPLQNAPHRDVVKQLDN